MWLHGSKGTKTVSDRRAIFAQDLGFTYDAPTTDDAKEGNGLYSEKHRNVAQELHRGKEALFSAWRALRKNTHRAGGFSVFLLKWRSRLAGGASRPPGPSGRGAIFIMVDRRLYLKYDSAL